MSQPIDPPQAKDFMNRRVQSVTPDMSLADVVRFLLGHGLSSAPVVETHDGRRTLAGFVSEHDCLEHLSNELFYGSTHEPSQTVATIMRRHPIGVPPAMDLFTLASVMVSHGLRQVPVVEDGDVVGLVSRREVLSAMEAYYRASLAAEAQERHVPSLREIVSQQVRVSPVRPVER